MPSLFSAGVGSAKGFRCSFGFVDFSGGGLVS